MRRQVQGVLLGEFEGQPEEGGARHAVLGPAGAVAHGGEGRLDGVGGAQVHPVLGGEGVRGQQGLAVLLQLRGGLRVIGPLAREEALEGAHGVLAVGRHPNGLEIPLGLALQRRRQGREHIAHLVESTALVNRRGVDLLKGRPEPQCAIAHGQARPDLKAPLLQVAQHVEPGFGGLTQPIADGDPLLGTVGGDADDDQQA